MSSNISESETYETAVVGPDDADPMTASSVRDGLQDLANRTKFLKARLSALVAIAFSHDDLFPSLSAPAMSTAGTNLTPGVTFGNLGGASAFAGTVTLTDLKAGDKVELEATCYGYITAPATEGYYRIGNSTGPIIALGASATITSTDIAAPERVYMRGVWTVPADVASQALKIMIATDDASGVITTHGPMNLTAKVHRA